jgi:hypothetical protein
LTNTECHFLAKRGRGGGESKGEGGEGGCYTDQGVNFYAVGPSPGANSTISAVVPLPMPACSVALFGANCSNTILVVQRGGVGAGVGCEVI